MRECSRREWIPGDVMGGATSLTDRVVLVHSIDLRDGHFRLDAAVLLMNCKFRSASSMSFCWMAPTNLLNSRSSASSSPQTITGSIVAAAIELSRRVEESAHVREFLRS